MNLGIVAVLWIGGIRVGESTLQVGKTIAFINYMTQILFALGMVSGVFTFIVRAKASWGQDRRRATHAGERAVCRTRAETGSAVRALSPAVRARDPAGSSPGRRRRAAARRLRLRRRVFRLSRLE